MITYSVIIGICMAIIASLNIVFNPLITWHYSIVSTCVFTAFAFLIDLLVATVLFIIPRKWYNPHSKFFKVFKFERKLYEKCGIRKWKDYLPIGAGPIGIGFKKDKVREPNNPEYIYKFLEESCLAEFMHLISPFTGFLILLFAPKSILLSIALPVAIVNFILEILPFFVQRYNRPKLMILYKRALKYSAQAPDETQNTKPENTNKEESSN